MGFVWSERLLKPIIKSLLLKEGGETDDRIKSRFCENSSHKVPNETPLIIQRNFFDRSQPFYRFLVD